MIIIIRTKLKFQNVDDYFNTFLLDSKLTKKFSKSPKCQLIEEIKAKILCDFDWSHRVYLDNCLSFLLVLKPSGL